MEEQKVTVEQIHGEFKGYPDALRGFLLDIDISLPEEKKKFEKLKELQKLGFINVGTDVRDPEEVFEEKKLESEQITELQFKYPQFKFISKRGITHLCNKYGLFHGRIENFKTAIPEKNINDILRSKDLLFGMDTTLSINLETTTSNGDTKITFNSFKDFKEHLINNHYLINVMNTAEDQSHKKTLIQMSISVKDKYTVYMAQRFGSSGSIGIIDNDDLAREIRFTSVQNNSLMFHAESMYGTHVPDRRERERKFYIEQQKRQERERLESAIKYQNKTIQNVLVAVEKAEDESKRTIGLSIIANHSDFTKLESYEAKTITAEIPKIQLPDPVVVKRTMYPDVFAIITAWDKEASDPLVFNQKLN